MLSMSASMNCRLSAYCLDFLVASSFARHNFRNRYNSPRTDIRCWGPELLPDFDFISSSSELKFPVHKQQSDLSARKQATANATKPIFRDASERVDLR